MAIILDDGDVTLPPKLERCVDALLKKKTFMPKVDAKKRKSSAYAICTASTKNQALVSQILHDLPPYIECNLNDDGEIVLTEVEDFDFAAFDEHGDKCDGECKECGACSADLAESQIFFSDEETDQSKEVFSSFTRVTLAQKNGSKKVMRRNPDGEEKEYTNVPIEMLREGTFRHPWFGDLVIDRKMMTKMIQNFVNDILERELALDVSHEPDKGAYGWLREAKLKRREFGKGKGKRNVLVGTWDLNERGEQMIRDEIFKYFSIEYHRNYSEREKTAKEIAEDQKKSPEEKDKARWEGTDKGQEYGPTIFGGALTNRPFIPSMQSVKMSEGATDGEGEPTGTIGHESPQKTTDGDDVEEMKSNSNGGDDTKEMNKKNGKKAADGCKSSDEESDNDNEIKNAAAEKKARPPESKLPDAAFALVKRDRSGTVIKRSLPHHGPNVKSPGENTSVDKGRLRNALARWNQVSGFSSEEKARGLRHLQTHAKALLPSYKKTKASEGGTMFEDRIAELKDQLDGMEDPTTELANKVRDEIAFLEKAKADHETKLNETKSQISDEMTAKLSEQQVLIEKLTERDKQREAKLAEITEKNRRTEIEMYCDDLGQKDYPPAVVKAVRNVLIGEVQQYAEGGPTVTFSEEVDGKVEKREFSFRSAVEYIVASIPESHKVDRSTTIKHDEKDEPEGGDDNGKLKLADGTEADLLDDAAIRASIGRAGFKTQEDPQ